MSWSNFSVGKYLLFLPFFSFIPYLLSRSLWPLAPSPEIPPSYTSLSNSQILFILPSHDELPSRLLLTYAFKVGKIQPLPPPMFFLPRAFPPRFFNKSNSLPKNLKINPPPCKI